MATRIPLKNIPGCTLDQADTIQSLVSIPENSTTSWWKNYGYIEDISDGRGYTTGLVGNTSGTHDLLMVIQELQKLDPNNELVKFIPALKKVDNSPSTVGLDEFKRIFQRSGANVHLQQAQWNIIVRLYWKPAYDLCKKYGLKSVLALYFIYDTCLNLGNAATAKKVKVKAPSEGGDEKEWLKQYLIERRAYMKATNNFGPVDRVDMQMKILESGNMDLTRPIKNLICYKGKFNIV